MKETIFGEKHGICGFVLEHYEAGTLREALWRGGMDLSLKVKCRWSREITSALIHIQEEYSTFYSGLKHVNIVISNQTDGPHAILLDFEQRRTIPMDASRDLLC
jgi:hypothetical protein